MLFTSSPLRSSITISFLVLPFLSSLMLVYLMAGYLVVGGASLLVEGIAMHRIER